MNKPFFYSLSVLIGTIIGVGIFGIPFTFSKAGILTGVIFLIILTAINLLINLAIGEISLRTEGNHQITGYADVYLGHTWKKIVLFSFSLVIYAALLSYIIVSGEFLGNVFSVTDISASSFLLSTLFFIIISFTVLGGLKEISRLELFISIALGAAVVVVAVMGFPKINFGSLLFFRKEFFFLPYGVLLFALRGTPAIPIQREILDGREELLKKSIIWGTLLTAFVYLIFAFVVVGVSGESTSPEAVSGLLSFLGFPVVFMLSLFGLMAISTSFLGLGRALFEVFHYDFNFSTPLSWFFTVIPPYVLFLMGARNFIDAISIGGAVALGVESIVVIFLYQKIKSKGVRIPEYSLNIGAWVWYALIALFGLGIVYALIF